MFLKETNDKEQSCAFICFTQNTISTSCSWILWQIIQSHLKTVMIVVVVTATAAAADVFSNIIIYDSYRTWSWKKKMYDFASAWVKMFIRKRLDLSIQTHNKWLVQLLRAAHFIRPYVFCSHSKRVNCTLEYNTVSKVNKKWCGFVCLAAVFVLFIYSDKPQRTPNRSHPLGFSCKQ